MNTQKDSVKDIIEYYENAKECFVAKMRSEDDDRSNLKFKIAAFVIHELSYSTPDWFKRHFLTYIAKNDHDIEDIDAKILKVEQAFYDAVADYLLKMESEVDYVKKAFADDFEEKEKALFWKSVVFDAFLIVGIYFSPSLALGKRSRSKDAKKSDERNVHPRYLPDNPSLRGRKTSVRLNRKWSAQGINLLQENV